MQRATPAFETQSVIVEQIKFHNEENGFSVLRVLPESKGPAFTLVGCVAQVQEGLHLSCEGVWHEDPQFGLQFKAHQITLMRPTEVAQIEKYLSAGLIQGIGPHYAKKLIQTFGVKVFEVMDNTPERLSEIPGIGKKRLAQIIESWETQKVVRDIMIFLQTHGIGMSRAVRIYKRYGAQAIQVIEDNPYRLTLDIHGIGFKLADSVALSLGFERTSLQRAQAGVRHVVQQSGGQGHCAMTLSALTSEAQRLLAVSEDIVSHAVDYEIQAGHLVSDLIEGEPCIYLAKIYQAESHVALHLKRLIESPAPKLDKAAISARIERLETGITLSSEQKAALMMAINSKVTIITGGPGVGKTTVMKSLIQLFNTHCQQIRLCAPTGRAAKRLAEVTDREAKTIHRLLEYDPALRDFRYNEVMPLEVELVVVDEVSMVDVVLMHALLQALPDKCRLVLVGDVDQLPSVGPGAVLHDLIASQRLAVAQLTEIYRQAQTSQIVQNAHKINKGELPIYHRDKATLTDFYFIPAKQAHAVQEKLLQVVTERIPERFGFDPLYEVQVLTPMNRGPVGAITLNELLKSHLNKRTKPEITRQGVSFSPGDKVIQTVNNYDKEVFNGDIGYIQEIDKDEGEVTIHFDGRDVIYQTNQLDEISLAYVTTVHKAQGAEYPAVVITLSMSHSVLLERNLLYTAMTRGKKLVVIIGAWEAIVRAVDNVRGRQRLTNLVGRCHEQLAATDQRA